MFAGKHMCWSYFLIKLQGWRTGIVLKRESNASAFLQILRNFLEHLFWSTSANGSSVLLIIKLLIKYLKGTNFRRYLFSRAKKNCISRVLIFANGYEQKILCALIFANSKKLRFFTTRNRQKKQYSVSQSLGKSTRF